MSQSCALLATTRGPVKILNDRIGFLIDPADQKEWYEKIQYFVEHPRILKKMQENAKEEAQKYFWPELAAKIDRLYKKILH
jgi:glycosyltransferase involved in cell wall biosynthesis